MTRFSSECFPDVRDYRIVIIGRNGRRGRSAASGCRRILCALSAGYDSVGAGPDRRPKSVSVLRRWSLLVACVRIEIRRVQCTAMLGRFLIGSLERIVNGRPRVSRR